MKEIIRNSTLSEREKRQVTAVNDLIKSKESKSKILDGIIVRCEHEVNMQVGYNDCAIIDYYGYKVIIPSCEMGFDTQMSKYHKTYIEAMLGAKISFKVLAVDVKTKRAVASRKKAMYIKQKKIFYGENPIGITAFKEGKTIRVPIVAVLDYSIRVDIGGVDTKIPMSELSHRYMTPEQIRKQFCVGEYTQIKINNLVIDGDSIEIEASVKDTKENPIRKSIEQVHTGDAVLATVTNVIEKGYFLSYGEADNGFDIYSGLVSCYELPSKGDLVRCTISTIELAKTPPRVFARITGIVRKGVA